MKPEDQSHCAGLMGVLWNEGIANVAMRLALWAKLITVRQLNACSKLTFRSLAEFSKHHVD